MRDKINTLTDDESIDKLNILSSALEESYEVVSIAASDTTIYLYMINDHARKIVMYSIHHDESSRKRKRDVI